MRIVSLSPSLTEILIRLGASEDLLAITDHCPEIRPELARIGSAKALQLEAIQNLAPDLILSDQNENRPEEIKLLKKNLRVISFDVRSIQAVLDAVSAIGREIKSDITTGLIREISEAAQENKRLAEGQRPLPSLILLWEQPFVTVNFDTYASRLLEASGGVNVFHSDPVREFPVDLEDMIEKNPELLILPTEPFAFAKRHIAKFRQYRVFSKIRIELMDGLLLSRYGPRTIQALETLRSILIGAPYDSKPI